jgi:tetratricopeptide (TPR) repeat protein
MMRCRGVIVVAVLLATLPPAGAAVRAPQDLVTVSLTQMLELYDIGEFEMVRKAVQKAARGDLSVVHVALKRDAAAWIDADGDTHRSRRRLTAAVFALEVAGAALDRQWLDALEMLEWACGVMRSEPRGSEAERTFHLAAIALIEGARDLRALDGHLVHVKSRFPDEPRMLLAQAFKSETEYWRLFRSLDLGYDGGDASIAVPALRKAGARQENAREVNLRLGFLAFQEDAYELALTDLARVSPGDDPGQLYLAHVISGWAYEKLKKTDQAIQAYRAALQEIPRGQVATLHLSAALYATDRRAEADALVEEMLHTDPPPDPWRIFGYGDYRRLPLLIETLRKAIQ